MVTTINRVLVAIGPDDRENVTEILDTVEAVAGPTQAEVYLLHVFTREEYENLTDQMSLEVGSGDLEPDDLAKRNDDVQTPADRLEKKGIAHEIRGTVGDPESEIVHTVEEIDADLLFIGGTSRSPTGKAVFGDIGQQILLSAPCPVTYIRRN